MNTQRNTICDLTDDIAKVLILNQPRQHVFGPLFPLFLSCFILCTHIVVLKIDSMRAYMRGNR